MEISSRASIGSVHCGSGSWDDCGRAFPDEFLLSSFPWWVPTLHIDSMVNPLWLRWVKGVCVCSCNRVPAPFFGRVIGVFCVLLRQHLGAKPGYKNNRLTQIVKSGEENPPAAPVGNRTCDLPIRVRRPTTERYRRHIGLSRYICWKRLKSVSK